MTSTSQPPAGQPDQPGQQQRISAVARTAAKVALRDSAESVLSAMAVEIRQTEGIAGAQIILVDTGTGAMRMMGSAGFSEDGGFFDWLMACHERGAPLATYEALRTGRQRVYPGRKAQMLADDRWRPLHAYIRELDWSDFIATPFQLEGVTSGVINAYVSQPGGHGSAIPEFLQTMADQAALTLDYHALIDRDRRRIRQEERSRLAHDLHDSAIQHVFTIGMYARTLESVLAHAGASPAAAKLTTEVQELVRVVQRDLRGIVRTLGPSPAAELGLAEAVRLLADGAPWHAGLAVRVNCDPAIGQANPEAADDMYYVISEAVHNVVKHAAATSVAVEVTAVPGGGIAVTVTDDGTGFTPSEAPLGYGVSSMRYRVSRWGGTLAFGRPPDGGTRVRADFPLARSNAAARS
jgi:signal transduction histidine kinase